MSATSQNSMFSRLRKPPALAAGAATMLLLGLVIGQFLAGLNPPHTEEKPSTSVSIPQSGGGFSSSGIAGRDDLPNPENSSPPKFPKVPGLFDPAPPADIQLTQADLSGQHTDAGSEFHGSPDADEQAIQTSSSLDLLNTDVFGNQVALADEQLRIGNYAAALHMYQLLAASTSGAMLAPLQFRLALCAELSGNFAEAINAYHRVSNSSIALDWNGLAVLGEARCLLAAERFDVLQAELFRRTLLDESSFPAAVRLELYHLIGRSLWAQLHVATSPALLDDATLVVPVWHPDPNAVLDELPQLLQRSTTSTEAPMLTVLQVSELHPDGIYLKAHSAPSPVASLLSGIIQSCQLQLQISEAAERALNSRRMTLHVQDRSLSLILDALTIPYGNVWTVEGSTVQILSFSEMATEQLLSFRQLAAERLLRVALLEAPDSRHAGHSRMALGTVQFERGNVADAAYTFRAQLEQNPRSHIEPETSFNLAKCLLNQNDKHEARRAFLLSVDTSGGPAELKASAYMYAGRLQIELGDPRGAVSTLMRALRLSEQSSLEPEASLLLASNYLLIGNPAGTSSVLMERRDVLRESSHKYAAAFLSAAAQLRAAALPSHREREGRDVVEAITHFAPEHQFGTHWCLLVGEAAEDLGLTETATEAYLKTLSQNPAPPLRNQIMLKLATRYRLDNRLDDARKLLASLGPDEAVEFTRLASLRSAEIALQQGRPADTITICQELVTENVPTELRRAALRIMGQAYEKQKNYTAAVYCFSGTTVGLPVTSTQPVLQDSTRPEPQPPGSAKTVAAPAERSRP